MKIFLDCDEVILDSAKTMRDFYHTIEPDFDIPADIYPSVWPQLKNDKERFLNAMEQFTHSEWFTKSQPLPGAVDGIRRLKSMGHKIYVLTAVGDDKNIQKRRQSQLISLVGNGVFEDIICIDVFVTKKEKMLEIGADILVDDGASNIFGALEIGVVGIWLRCPENKQMMNDVLSDNYNNPEHFWEFDARMLRDRAIVAYDWNDVVDIIEKFERT